MLGRHHRAFRAISSHDAVMTVTAAPWVTRNEVARLPRLAVWAFCLTWLVPGLVGRDPWRHADVTSFAVMSAMAEGRSSWWHPVIAGVPVEVGLLPHWLGAGAIVLLGELLGPVLAVRLVFGALLGVTMAAIWYATFHLARTEAAQPAALPFGGEAPPVDYARALADGALLAMLATLGLLQLGHETTEEALQLAAVAAFLWATAAAPWRGFSARLVVVISLPVLAGSGAPWLAVSVGLVGALICARSSYEGARQLVPWVFAAVVAAAATTTVLSTWTWSVSLQPSWAEFGQILRQWSWFLWPSWPLALWTIWRWRAHWASRHVALPQGVALCVIASSVLLGGDDRTLMLAVPGMAILAAFALPTFQRAASAAIDWFSIFFFSASALFVWFMYVAMQTGWPAKPAANVAKLAVGFEPPFSPSALALGMMGTCVWLALVRWRTERRMHPLWKSLVLPAGGVVLCWLLLMTLWLPLLDYARSYRPVVSKLLPHLGDPAKCVAVTGAGTSLLASLEVMTVHRIDGRPASAAEGSCTTRIHVVKSDREGLPATLPGGWELQTRVARPTDRDEQLGVYRRLPETR